MIEEGDTDIIRGELVDNVVGRPVKHHVRDLLYIRHCLLENNELYVQLVRNIRSLKRRKAILGRSLEALEQQWEGQVWVPPSSCGAMSAHHVKLKKKFMGTKEDIKATKTESRALSRELRGLELKRVFFVWKMQSVLHREMEAMMVSIEKYTNMDLVRESFEGWKAVAEPWAYDSSVLEHMEIFRRVCQLGLLDRMVASWRHVGHTRNDLEDRRGMFVIYRDRQLLKDALTQWKVYRVVHHLTAMRRHMAGAFDSLRLRKRCFMYWMKRTRRRLELEKRMTHGIFQCGIQVQYTVDDLLLMGPASRPNAYTQFQSIREDVCHLQEAANLMRHRVRWNNLDGLVYTRKTPIVEYDPEKYMDRDGIKNSLLEKIQISRGEILQLQQEEKDVRRAMEDVVKDIARDTRKHKLTVQNLAEYEYAASELENVQKKLDNQLKSMTEMTKTKEGEYLEKVALVNQLEEMHHSLSDALHKAKADVISHSTKLDKTCDEIREWKTKVRQHSKAAMSDKQDGSTCTSAVMLEESRSRLRKAELRLEKLTNTQDKVRDVQNKASSSERQVRMELEDAWKARNEAQHVYEKSQTIVENIRTKVVSLENDYEDIMLRIDKVVKYADELHKRIEDAVEKQSHLNATLDSLTADVQTHQETIRSLEQQIQRLEEDFQETTVEDEYVELSSDTGVSIPMSSGPVSTRPYVIPGDRILSQAARSYAILRHAKSYFSRWRRHTGLIRVIVQESQDAYNAQCTFEAFVQWRHTIVSQQHMATNAHRMWISKIVLKSWREGKNVIKKHTYLVQSYQALARVKTKQHVLRAWREAVYVEQAGSDAECRLKNQKLCSLFHFWRKETCQNMTLRIRYLEYCQAQEDALSKRFFSQWRVATKQRRLVYRVLTRACNAWAVRLREEHYAANVPRVLHDCMSVWSMQVHVSREDRRLQSLCDYIKEKRNMTLSRRIFENWNRTMMEMTSFRVDSIDRIQSKRVHDTLQDCFYHLRAFSNHRVARTVSLRVAWTCDHPQRFALNAWMRAVEKARHQKALDDICLELRHALLVSKDNQQARIRAVPAALYTDDKRSLSIPESPGIPPACDPGNPVVSPPKRVLDPSQNVLSPGDDGAISV